ncbi:MAG TPA: AAA family ATPase, partial [Lacipirellulaceae bacterium]|nr:AAA family ATPase [Lacipirellulaceae bacterium]
DALTFAIIARHDDLLYRTKIASRIEYFLYRKAEPIPLLEACSGEICFITTVAFISAQIESRSVIAIDEPDTSLHPTWQQSYVKTLLDLFHRYEPRILISTHSPIIISGAEAASGAVAVFEMKGGEA